MNQETIICEVVKYQPQNEEEVNSKIINNKSRLSSLFKRIVNLKPFFGDFKTLMSMIIDWKKGSYKNLSKTTIMLVGGALIYVLTPFDIVHDWLPIVGYVDDAAVIGYILKKCSTEIEKYREWKKFNIDVEEEN